MAAQQEIVAAAAPSAECKLSVDDGDRQTDKQMLFDGLVGLVVRGKCDDSFSSFDYNCYFMKE